MCSLVLEVLLSNATTNASQLEMLTIAAYVSADGPLDLLHFVLVFFGFGGTKGRSELFRCQISLLLQSCAQYFNMRRNPKLVLAFLVTVAKM